MALLTFSGSETRRFARACIAAAIALLGCLAAVPGTAQAGAGAGTTPTFPTTVTVGQTITATIELRNLNTTPNELDTNTVCNAGDPFPCVVGEPGITLIASCGQLGAFSSCAPGGADPNVFDPAPTAVGEVGTACAGLIFDVTEIDPVFGQLRLTPQGGAHVLLPGNTAICRIAMSFFVANSPTVDQNPILAGRQTVQITDHTQFTGIITASVRGTSSGTTVLRAAPAIATTASPDVTIGAGTLADTAVVGGRVNPQPGATVTFSLFGPGDATCAGAPIFTATVGYPVAGGPVTSPAFTPTTAGTYRWIAAYSGDVNNAPVTGACNDANETTVVNRATPTIATNASPTITVGAGTLSDVAIVSGRVNPQAGATITFRLFGPGDATCTGAPVFAPAPVSYPVAGGPVTSPAFTPTSAGTYRWIAAYSGDANNAPVTGACNEATETTVVNRATPTIATNASPNVAVGAGTLTDTAIVGGRVNPQAGATITFTLFGPGNVTCTGAPVFAPAPVAYPVAGGPVTSPAFTPVVTGTYRWIAAYSGDANNAPVTGACNDANENVVVALSVPTIATTASADITVGSGTITDTAVVSGRVNPVAGATITFSLFGPNDATCAGAPVFSPAPVPYPVAGGPVTSAAFTPTTAGTYRWIAAYSGDANNAPVTGPCNAADENVVVNRSTPAIATTASADITVGAGTLTDTAIVSGRVNPQPGATIDFRLYGPGDATCSGTPAFESLNVPYPVAGGPVTSAAFTPPTAGTYRWRATYGGDVNNVPVAGACNDANETVVVGRVTPTIVTTATPTITVGTAQLTDTAIVSGRVNPQPGATIDFRLYGPGDTTCSGTPVFESVGLPYPTAGGPVTSAAYTPTSPGTYRWRATYSGDANNAPVTGACNEANETSTVTPAGEAPQPPPPPLPCTPPPGPAPPGGTLCPRGTANVAGTQTTSGCQGRPFRVRIRGRQIRSVVFFLDGRRIATVTRPNVGDQYTVQIYPARLRSGTHRVLARVTFVTQSGTRARTLRVVFNRCTRSVQPRFTG